MEMWRKEVALLLLAVAAMLISGEETVILDDKQKNKDILFGSSLILICRLGTVNAERYRVNFNFSPPGPSFNESNSKNLSNRFFMGSTSTSTSVIDSEENGLRVTLNATAVESGWYICQIKVELPELKFYTSKGTEINVAKSKEHTTYSPKPPIVTGNKVTKDHHFLQLAWWMWLLLGVSTVILLVLLLICILLRRRYRRLRETSQPIYANTRMVTKQPSPRPGMQANTLKKDSSCQNIQTPNPARRHGHEKRRNRP